jgi:CRISPR-associated exonuclease Cas4
MLEHVKQDQFYFTVTDLKQFQYCQRIIYFTYVQPVPRRVTRLMKFGEERHLDLERLEPRRVVRKYGLAEGRKVFREHLISKKFGISGKLDLSIHTPETIYPVEFKFTEEKEPRQNYIGQLAAYALLLEENYGIPVERGFFYRTPLKKIVGVNLTDDRKQQVIAGLEQMRELVGKEAFPPMAKERGKCVDCEWLNFCGDVLVPERSGPVIGYFAK